MAVVTVGALVSGLNMDRIDVGPLIEGIPRVQASTRFELGYQGSVWGEAFTGTGFTYDSAGEPVSGTITEYTRHDSAVNQFTFSGIAIPVEQMVNWVSNSDTAGFLTTVLGGADTIFGGAYGDLLRGYGGQDYIEGGGGADSIDGGAGSNTLFGGDGNDQIITAAGAAFNQINGNKGDDFIMGRSTVGDWLLGGQGHDWINAAQSTGRNIINGNIGNDTIQGGSTGDTLRGGQGDDYFWAGKGDDLIYGDLGNDTIDGGGGANEFHFSWGGGSDHVENFFRDDGRGDRVVLHGTGSYTLIDDWVQNKWLIDMGNGQVIVLRYNDSGFADNGHFQDYGKWITVVP